MLKKRVGNDCFSLCNSPFDGTNFVFIIVTYQCITFLSSTRCFHWSDVVLQNKSKKNPFRNVLHQCKIRCFYFLFQWLQMQFIVTSKHERKKPEICTTLPQNMQVYGRSVVWEYCCRQLFN